MKKLLFIAILLFSICFTMKAQEAGQKWIGGGISFSTDKQRHADRANNFTFIPEIGYQLSERWGIGVSLGYKHQEHISRDISGPYKTIYNGFEVNPFARYTFFKKDIISLFADGGVGYSHLKATDGYYSDYRLSVGIRPGIALDISENIRFTSKIGFFGYQNINSDSYADKIDSFKFDLNMSQVLFGVNVIF
ncbi:outer membrane beta-barrel protein [Dysgonomonas sp. 25]|uniref:outer membrane beta-barrel protein n=1 Tax=Dysgonomonas sp. 25 TaxID=2302933 RepID=UPI0021041A4F|nr:outer membrane beta-barrel protein [Dysgonomonas sp. 25]NDV68387.1 porin family protein [Dysgonomonas sp. 25]